MLVHQIMTMAIRTCGLDDSLFDAAKLMHEHDCGAVIVLDDDKRVVGIVTDRDVCLAAYEKNRVLGDIAVRRIMASPVVTCAPSDDVEEAERTMQAHRVRRLPVVTHHQHPVGIVSLDDIAREIIRMEARIAKGGRAPAGITAADVGWTLARVCRHSSQAVPKA